jgi:hypothetical protein
VNANVGAASRPPASTIGLGHFGEIQVREENGHLRNRDRDRREVDGVSSGIALVEPGGHVIRTGWRWMVRV